MNHRTLSSGRHVVIHLRTFVALSTLVLVTAALLVVGSRVAPKRLAALAANAVEPAAHTGELATPLPPPPRRMTSVDEVEIIDVGPRTPATKKPRAPKRAPVTERRDEADLASTLLDRGLWGT